MYCSSCGALINQNLIYCNCCGAYLSNGAKDDGGKALEISPNILVPAMVMTFVFGMAAIVALLSAARGGDPIAIVVLGLSFLLLLALEGMFVWLLLRRKKVGRDVNVADRLNEQTRKELYATPAQMLAEPIPSVTEQTTGLLEPIYRDQNSK